MRWAVLLVVTAPALGVPRTTVAQPIGAPSSADSAMTATSAVKTPTVTSATQTASRYGLSMDEWETYQSVMGEGPALWPHSMHPLMVLGFEAASDTERRRFAERYADHEFARLQKADAFTVIWEQVWQQRYGDLVRTLLAPPQPPRAFSSAERVALFTEAGCPACDARLQQLLFSLDAGEMAGLDIYLVGMAGDDAIRLWARQHAVSPEAVKGGHVTLNHDAGLLRELVGDPVSPLPVVLRDKGPGGFDVLRTVGQ